MDCFFTIFKLKFFAAIENINCQKKKMVALSDYVFYADHDAKNKVSSRKLTCPLILKKKKHLIHF